MPCIFIHTFHVELAETKGIENDRMSGELLGEWGTPSPISGQWGGWAGLRTEGTGNQLTKIFLALTLFPLVLKVSDK